MPELNFKFASLNELQGFCTEFMLQWGKGVDNAKTTKAKTEDAEPATKKSKAEDATEKTDKKKPADDDTKVTYEQVRAAMLKLDDTDEEENIPAVLAKFGVEKLSELKEKDFSKVKDQFEKLYNRSSPLVGKD